MRFQGRRALVTGSSSGVGRAVAVLLASEGAQVAIHYHQDAASAEKTATACGMASGQVPAVIRADLADWEAGERCVSEAAAALGGLDLCVLAHGHNDPAAFEVPWDRIDEALWGQVLDIDLRGTFAVAQAAGRRMQHRGGAIVTVGTTPALVGGNRAIAHAVAKAGALALTRGLAKDLAPNVRVNAVAIGAVQSGWLQSLDQDLQEALRARIPLERFGRAEDAARAILYLASDDAAFVTGQTVIVDGGQIMR